MAKETTIQRVPHDRRYTVITNAALQNKHLSWKARGLLAYLLSLPDDWRVYIKELAEHATDGECATRSALKELLACGHVVKTTERDDKGRIKAVRYYIHESPSPLVHTHEPDALNLENLNQDNPNADNSALQSTHEQSTHEQSTHEGACAPDPSELTVNEIRGLCLTDEEWQELSKVEKAGKNRAGVLRHIRATLNRPPPAVLVYRGIVERFPKKTLWEGIDQVVGGDKENLAFWERVVKNYVACGWNELNISGMLEFYKRREIPTTGNNSRRNSNRQPADAPPQRTPEQDARITEMMLEKEKQRHERLKREDAELAQMEPANV